MKSPKEEIVKACCEGDLGEKEAVKQIKSQEFMAFSDAIYSVFEDTAALDHPDCPDFKDWWKGEI